MIFKNFLKGSDCKLSMEIGAGFVDGLFVDVVDFLGQSEILGGDFIPGVVSGKAEMHCAIADIDIG